LPPTATTRTLTPSLFNRPATTELYTLSLHDALPISLTRGGTRRTQPTRAPFHPARPGASRSKGCLRAPALRSTGCRSGAHSKTCLPVRTPSPYAPAGSPPTTDWWSSFPEHHPP